MPGFDVGHAVSEKEAMRVLQLVEPSFFRYSPATQNVQSSEGSIARLVVRPQTAPCVCDPLPAMIRFSAQTAEEGHPTFCR